MAPTRFRLLAAIVAALAFTPAAAQAATVSIQDGTLTITGGSEANNVSVTAIAGQVNVTDIPNSMTAGPGCSTLLLVVSCSTGDFARASIDLGDGNDAVDFGFSVPATIKGGAGNDTLTGGTGNDVLDGETGADVLNGGGGTDTAHYAERTAQVIVVTFDDVAQDGEKGEGDDVGADVESIRGGKGDDRLFAGDGNGTVDGGPGNDVIEGGKGADLLVGGDGSDLVAYVLRTVAVSATLDNLANDGEPAENDKIADDVESLAGGAGNDIIAGSGGPNTLLGFDGNDTVSGGEGNDVIEGGKGADVMSGGGGADQVTYAARTAPVTANLDGVANDGESGENDRIGGDVEGLVGGSANDTLTGDGNANVLIGGGGADTLDGAGGADALRGGTGDDLIRARGDNAADDLACEAGTDTATADAEDKVASDCEKVDRPATVAPPVTPPATGNAPKVNIVTRRATPSKRGTITVVVRCPTSALNGCDGELEVRTRRSGTAFRTTRFALGFGGSKVARFRLPAKLRRDLARRKTMRIYAVAETEDNGDTTIARRTITLRARRT